MEDEGGTQFCEECAADAMDSGVFTDDDGDDDGGEPWVDVWEERDNLQIVLYVGTPNDADDSEEIAAWTDDDARDMIESGFFKSGRGLKDSVIAYAREQGMIG